MAGPPLTFGAAPDRPTPQQRNVQANIGQSEAGAASSRASAAKSGAETVTETQMRGPKVSKATSDK